MSNPTAVSRTAPIPIAPKPAKSRSAVSLSSAASARGPQQQQQQQQHHLHRRRPDSFGGGRFETGHASLPNPGGFTHSGSFGPRTPPCEACRRARMKCVVMPEDDDGCVSCQANGADCSLVSTPPMRKRKLNGDSIEDVLGKASSPGGTPHKRRQPESPPSPTTGGEFLADMANIGGPARLKRTLGLQNDRFSQYIGPTTDFEPSLIKLSPFNPDDESLLSRGTLRKVSEKDTFLMLPDATTPGHERVVQDADEIERVVAPHGRKLIDLYFNVVHPAFPIIQKTVFLEKYERTHREFTPALLAAVYILAINWWHHSEELSSQPKPDVKALEKIVRVSLADAMFRPKLSTIQAGLLLSQRPEGDQWAPTAQLVAVSQELGLHLDCSGWKIPPWEKGLRKRLAWALYMQDKWGALVHGRPSHIFSSNWAVQEITEHDFQDVEWDERDGEAEMDIRKGRLVFVRMVRLSQILAEILDTFYTLNAMQTVAAAGAKGTEMVLALAKPIQLKLKEWYSKMEPMIRMDSSPSAIAASSNRLTSIGYLHLAYFATEITLHRRILRSLASAPTGVIEPYLLNICRGASKARLISAMDFVNRLTPSHLRAFWYFASKTNFALIGTFGSLLWATSDSREEAEWYRRRLGEYRWTLSVSSKPGEGKGLTEFAMTMLDISTGLLKKLPEKPAMSRNGSVAEGMAGVVNGGGGGGIGLAGPSSSSSHAGLLGGGSNGFIIGIDDLPELAEEDEDSRAATPITVDSDSDDDDDMYER